MVYLIFNDEAKLAEAYGKEAFANFDFADFVTSYTFWKDMIPAKADVHEWVDEYMECECKTAHR